MQNLLLPVGRQAVEVLQPLLELLLPLRRQVTECGIVFQRAPLLVEWLLAMLI
jgi:hypothetical protein